jgi:phenylacetaldehyde dehydrogenase
MMHIPPLMDLIDGQLTPPTTATGVWLENPNTGERLQQQYATPPENVERALAAAWRVHESGAWAGLPMDERAALLAAFSAELDKRKAHIAHLESLTTGAVIRTTTMLGIITTGAWLLAIEQMKSGWDRQTLPGPNNHTVEVLRRPWGPALALVPWNAPAPMAAHKVANALAAGAPCILKPSEWAPNGCDVFAEAAQAAGIPPGVFQIVHGGPGVGGVLVKDRRIRSVSFTGGLKGGREIAQACAWDFKPAQLELGGNNPVIVLADADLDAAAEGVVALLTTLNGQWCRALGRLIVHEAVQDALLERVLALLASLRIGSSLDDDSQMGPLVHSQHKRRIEGQCDALLAKGAKALSTSRLPDAGGSFMAPALLINADPADTQDEIFGPVGVVHPFATDAEALALANGTPYGLEGYVFAGDEERGLALARQVRAGGVKVNGSSMISLHLMAPRPAWGWSGFSEEGTAETYRFFMGTRVVGVEGPLPTGT